MMATVLHVTSGLGLRKFQADEFLLTRVYMYKRIFYTYMIDQQMQTHMFNHILFFTNMFQSFL